MIHEIRIANYYGVKDENVLDLRIPKNAPDLPRFRRSRSRKDVRLPTVVTLFGPNASGKSTILRALTSTIRFVCTSFDLGVEESIPNFQAFMSDEYGAKPTRVSVVFDAAWLAKSPEDEAQLFRYELELTSSDGLPVSRNIAAYEALFHFPKGKRRRLFERTSEEKIYLSREFGIGANDPRLRAVRKNCSVISTLAKLNNELAIRIYTDLVNLQSNLWGVTRAQVQAGQAIQTYSKHPELLERLNHELHRFDVGISRMELQQAESGTFAWFRHDGLAAPILLDEESSGTQHFVSMFPMLNFVLHAGHIAVFDEFDADLHPDLVRELFDWFHSTERNPHGAQVFVALHNAALLDFLEKEEVFLVQKDLFGATEIYGAADVKGLRREVSIYNKYMGGELGALPRIG